MSDPLRAGLRCRCNDGASCAAERHVGPVVAIARLQEERDAARAEVEQLREEVRRWSSAMSDRGEVLFAAQAERDRIAAVLATTRENVETLVQAVGERYITQAAVCTILASLRARAGQP